MINSNVCIRNIEYEITYEQDIHTEITFITYEEDIYLWTRNKNQVDYLCLIPHILTKT